MEVRRTRPAANAGRRAPPANDDWMAPQGSGSSSRAANERAPSAPRPARNGVPSNAPSSYKDGVGVPHHADAHRSPASASVTAVATATRSSSAHRHRAAGATAASSAGTITMNHPAAFATPARHAPSTASPQMVGALSAAPGATLQNLSRPPSARRNSVGLTAPPPFATDEDFDGWRDSPATPAGGTAAPQSRPSSAYQRSASERPPSANDSHAFERPSSAASQAGCTTSARQGSVAGLAGRPSSGGGGGGYAGAHGVHGLLRGFTSPSPSQQGGGAATPPAPYGVSPSLHRPRPGSASSTGAEVSILERSGSGTERRDRNQQFSADPYNADPQASFDHDDPDALVRSSRTSPPPTTPGPASAASATATPSHQPRVSTIMQQRTPASLPRHAAAAAGGGGMSYGGAPGMTMSMVDADQVPPVLPQEMLDLRSDNVRLEKEVQHLRELLTTLRVPPAVTTGGTPGGADRGMHASPSGLSSGTELGQALRYKAQVVQLQRQVLLCTQELQARGRLVCEAEGVLLEVASRLGDVSSMDVPNGAGADSAAVVGQCRGLQKWSREMISRLKSERSQSAKLMTRHGLHSGSKRPGAPSGGASWGSGPPAAGGSGAAAAQQAWEVPFVPAGGNRFLQQHPVGGAEDDSDAEDADPADTTMAQICAGQGVLLASPSAAHQLESQLCGLAPRLGALAVLVRTTLLPALPWLNVEASQRLQVEVAEVAQATAAAAGGLSQLCALLPAAPRSAEEGEARRRAAERDAGRDAWLWSSPDLTTPDPLAEAIEGASAGGENGGGQQQQQQLDVAALVAHVTPLLKDKKTGVKAVQVMLERVRAVHATAQSRSALLEAELRFAARTTALQSHHIACVLATTPPNRASSNRDVVDREACSLAVAGLQQVADAQEDLERHPNEACLQTLVEVLREQREAMEAATLLLQRMAGQRAGQKPDTEAHGLTAGTFRAALEDLHAQQLEQGGGMFTFDQSAEAVAALSNNRRAPAAAAAGAAAAPSGRTHNTGGRGTFADEGMSADHSSNRPVGRGPPPSWDDQPVGQGAPRTERPPFDLGAPLFDGGDWGGDGGGAPPPKKVAPGGTKATKRSPLVQQEWQD